MEVSSCLRMNGSDHGANSYANNSTPQRTAISKTRPVMERTIRNMHHNMPVPEQCFVMVDMGCSSGPNTLVSLSNIVDVIVSLSEETGQSPPELQVFLNDLPINDFNSIFMSLPSFCQNEKGNHASMSCYVSGTPGSFYERLFPRSSLHLVHSSYSLHWLSQVPRGIENNKGNICVGSTSPHNVCEAYMEQFRLDFSNFLSHRAKELKQGGGMILTLMGKSDDPTCRDSCLVYDLLSKSLHDMINEGMIEEGDLDSFDIPIYHPSKREVKEIVEREGSFNIGELHSFETNWDGNKEENYAFDEQKSGQNVANIVRAVFESLLTNHFGHGVIQDLFSKYAKHIANHLHMEMTKTKYLNIVVSMTKK